MTCLSIKLLILGGAIALSVMATMPASAQVQCPPGYNYQYGYGCIPASSAYGDMYGDDYGYDAPVYDGFGLAFGFGGGGRGGGAGGFHGGGGHAGGGHGGGGHHR
jgi:hypothetical protein